MFKAGAVGEGAHVVVDGHGVIVDGRGAVACDDVVLVRRDSGEDLGSEGARNLNRNVTDSACAGVDQHQLVRMDIGAVHEAFPRGDCAQRQSRSLAHGEGARFMCE